MLSFFQQFQKFCKSEKVAIDNLVFRLHYKVTVILLVLFSAMLTAKQYFGDPIDCFTNDKNVPGKMVSTYCWVHGTYTLRNLKMDQTRAFTPEERSYFARMGHNGSAHHGIATSDPARNYKVYHTYYQWVGFILFFQAILFYLPRHIWKQVEDGRVKFCINGMKDPELDDGARLERARRLVKCFEKFKNRNNIYAVQFFFFEILNLMNVLVQINYINKFLGGRFVDYGSQIFQFYNHIDMGIDPMVEVFPKVTKCQFNRHGPGGDIINHDALCLLPLNIVNEKIYLVMWFWLLFLALTSLVAVFYRAACIIIPTVRTYILWGETSKWTDIAKICKDGRYGDWFLLRQINKNVDQETFGDFLLLLSSKMRSLGTPTQSRFSTLLVRATSGWLRSQDSVSSCTSGIAERKGFHTDPSI